MKRASLLGKPFWPSCERVSVTESDASDRRLSPGESAPAGSHSPAWPACHVFGPQRAAHSEALRLARSRGETRDKPLRSFLAAVAHERIQNAVEEPMRAPSQGAEP